MDKHLNIEIVCDNMVYKNVKFHILCEHFMNFQVFQAFIFIATLDICIVCNVQTLQVSVTISCLHSH